MNFFNGTVLFCNDQIIEWVVKMVRFSKEPGVRPFGRRGSI